jgi:hypothetical protein
VKTKRKRQSESSSSGIEALERQLQTNGLLRNGWRVATETDGPKLSAVLLELIKPYTKDARTREAYERLVAIAVISWNAALQEGEARRNYVQTFVNTIIDMAGEEWRKDTESTIKMLMQRKERHFAADMRFIVDYRLTETSEEYHLTVASLVKN